MEEKKSPPSSSLTTAMTLCGVLCMGGAIAWAVWGAVDRGYLVPGSWVLGGVGVLFFLAAFARAEVANLRHYVNVGLYTIFAIASCVTIYLGFRRHDFQIDLTEGKLHTLSNSTRQYLHLLDKEVEIVVFDIDAKPYEELLNRYTALSSKVVWSVHDPSRDPEFTRRFAPQVREQTIFFVHGDRKKQIAGVELDENMVTNAIVEVTRGKKIRVYFLGGHGELALAAPKATPSGATRSVSAFARFLATRAMEVAQLDLAEVGFVPDDADLIVIAGPASDLHPLEAGLLAEYLEEGGKMLLFFDLPTTTLESVDFTRLAELLRRWGLDDAERIIFDYTGAQLDDSVLKIPIKELNADHVITGELSKSAESTITVPWVRNLEPVLPYPKGLEITPLAVSSNRAWVDDFAVVRTRTTHGPPDGKLASRGLGWAIERKRGAEGPGTRIVAYGTSRFVNDNFITKHNTVAVLMLNTVNWLTEQDDLISVPPRMIQGTPLILTNSQMQLILILVGLALPAAIFFGGLGYARLVRSR